MTRSFSCLVAIFFFATAGTNGPLKASPYDDKILQDSPVIYLPLSAGHDHFVAEDMAPGHHHGVYRPQQNPPTRTRLPNGDTATVFDGAGHYLEVPSFAQLSIPAGGALTIEAWMRPDTLNFPFQEGDGYVHWLGKGEPGGYEYAARMYSYVNTASPSRANRISGYVFNPQGGLGSGSYFQDPVVLGAWLHVAIVVDTRTSNPTSGGTVAIYKNGMLRKVTPLSQFDVTPEPGLAPLRVGTRDFRSFFKGAIAKVAIFRKALPDVTIKRHAKWE